jgi:hypothetical protein
MKVSEFLAEQVCPFVRAFLQLPIQINKGLIQKPTSQIPSFLALIANILVLLEPERFQVNLRARKG